jgi:hypothetical protein
VKATSARQVVGPVVACAAIGPGASREAKGFIYGSYRAELTETQMGRPTPPQHPRRGVAYVRSAVGGSVSTLSFEGTTTQDRFRSRRRRGGGIRDRVKGFSKASRRNLLRRLASVDRRAFRSFKGRIIFVTLTYPRQYPSDPEVCKGHLKALRKRLQRRYGPFAALWRLGIQRRGAWHFHLMLFAGPSLGPVGELRRFVSSAWYEVCGEASKGHLRAGTRVETVRRWKQATSYAERYVAKPEAFPEGLRTGRVWGIWNAGLLPVRWERVPIGLRDAFRVRRAYGKLAGRRVSGTLHSTTVFVRHENVVRLLEFLGYRLE